MRYTWLLWSLLLLGIWALMYYSLKQRDDRKRMLMVSLWTSITGLTEPLFVPEYWSPPSLFNLNAVTGFDIESVLWAFGVGGIAVVVYTFLFPASEKKMALPERHSFRHRHHLAALLAAPIILLVLLITTSFNPIYSSVIAMTAGGFATWYCRPDLKKKMLASALLFLGIYVIYFFTLIAMSPGYVERVWNLSAISGVLILGVPLEELLFALSFGFLWSSIYEHVMWRKLQSSGHAVLQ